MNTEIERDSLLRETVARHFPHARIDADAIDLGFGKLRLSCWIHAVRSLGPYTSASLFFQLRGGCIGDAPVFASVSGYADTTEKAIVTGACNWTCAFGPVLRAGLAGQDIPEVARFDVTVDGQAFRVFVDGLDRMVMLERGDAAQRMATARVRFTESWLVRALVESGQLPLLHGERPTVVSAFVSDATSSRIVEVKVNGRDWAGMDAVFAAVPAEPPGAIALLRELAVVVPIGPAPALARGPIVRTLNGLARSSNEHAAVTWTGWQNHGGQLAPPLSAAQIEKLEARIGTLPDDYRAFVTEVGAFGAGPGYGLMSPLGALAARIATGEFAWEHDAEPDARIAGAIPLAHGGCGVVWLLVLSGPHAGEVWADARSSDSRARRVAPTFTAWYRDWLGAAVQDAQPWVQWDSGCCATASVLSQVLTAIARDGIADVDRASEMAKRLKAGSIGLATLGGDYFAERATLNPCQGCAALAARFHLGAETFQRGTEPPLDPNDEPAEPRKSWFARLTRRARTRL